MAVGRFMLADGRPPDKPWMAEEMVRAFKPETVPILSRHASKGGVLLGYLDSLWAEGPDLHFTGDVSGWSDLREIIGRGVPVSIEPCTGVDPRMAWPGHGRGDTDAEPLSITHPHFLGHLAIGQNLIGVALTNNPAARGSLIWIVD